MENDPNDLLRRELDDWSVEAATVDLVSSLDIIVCWCSAQPGDIFDELAREIPAVLGEDPAFRYSSSGDEPHGRLMTFFLHLPTHPPQPTLARVLVLRGIVDLLIFQHRASADDWSVKADEMRRFNTPAVEEYCQANGIVAPSPEDEAERARLWIDSAESWRKRAGRIVQLLSVVTQVVRYP